MLKEFSRGHNAVVYWNDKGNQPPPFSHADLVRIEPCLHFEDGTFIFCQMQLAQIAFPGNFPEVIAFKVGINDPKAFVDRGGIQSYEPPFYLYSKRTSTPSEHNIFCDHIGHDLEGYKIHTCPCSACSSHALLHEKQHGNMHAFVRDALQAGIQLPYDDPTDWCLNDNGGIVFFEINKLDIATLSRYIHHLDLPQSQQAKADRLIRAYKKVNREMGIK